MQISEHRSDRLETILPSTQIGESNNRENNPSNSSLRNNTRSNDPVIGPLGNMQAIGDSILEFNEEEQRSIPDVVGQELRISMVNNAVVGAEFFGSEGIPSLYQSGSFSHVLVNGGGNDFDRGCSQTVVDDIISPNLRSGLMVDLVNQISSDGAQSVIMGYFLPRDREIGCPLMTELMARYSRLAEKLQDVVYINTLDTITPNTPEFYFAPNDPIHPSPAGSEAVGQLIADRLRNGNGDAGLNLRILGNEEDNTLQGGSGDDRIRGNDGNDRMKGGKGQDRLIGCKGDDQLMGSGGDDTLRGGADDDTLRGGSGDDRLIAGSGNDVLMGQRGSDQYVLSKNAFADIQTFDASEDRFRIRGISRFNQLQVFERGNDTEVRQGDKTFAVFRNVTAADLSADVYG